jgi:hypothetical protein
LFYPDCWNTLAALAARTHRLRLGSWVSCVAYRHPIQLARAATDVDRMSDVRLALGIGIGDIPDEFAQLGIPFGATRERQQRLEETVHIVSSLLRGEPVTFASEYYLIVEVAVTSIVLIASLYTAIVFREEHVYRQAVEDQGERPRYGGYSTINVKAGLPASRPTCVGLPSHVLLRRT